MDKHPVACVNSHVLYTQLYYIPLTPVTSGSTMYISFSWCLFSTNIFQMPAPWTTHEQKVFLEEELIAFKKVGDRLTKYHFQIRDWYDQSNPTISESVIYHTSNQANSDPTLML